MEGIFIVGYWNSGTTLLVDILRHHPVLKLKKARFKPNLEDRTIIKHLRKSGGDFIYLSPYYKEIIEYGFEHYEEKIPMGEDKDRFNRLFNRSYAVKRDKQLLLKNPWLWFMPKLIAENFERWDLKKLTIIRNGRMQVTSKDYWLKDPNPEKALIARAKFWVRSMEFYFEHWHGREDCLNLRYENLCSSPVDTLNRICDFIDIDIRPLEKYIPRSLSIRSSKWDELPENLKQEVDAIIAPMQDQLDDRLPEHYHQ